MAKLLRFSFFSALLYSTAQQIDAQRLIFILTPTGIGNTHGTSWRKAVDSPRFQIAINNAAISSAVTPGHGGLVWSEITSSS